MAADPETQRILAKAAEDATTKNLAAIAEDNRNLRAQVDELAHRVDRLETALGAHRAVFSEFQATAYSQLAATVYQLRLNVEEHLRGDD